jgi:GT2 family glycosyltransferase
MIKIAVLLTCHNRKEKTIKCIKSLYAAINISDSETMFEIYLVDDGSTDGTSEEIAKNYSKINLIQGSGKLFWAGGMRLAWETALKKDQDYNFFLLLNDDVILMENFLNGLLNTHKYCLEQYNQAGIYVFSTIDPSNSNISYGGTLIIKKGIRIKSKRINPTNVPLPCSMANANILMITSAVVKAIGIFDPKYTHNFADYDYTLNASKQGIPVLVCPGFGGYCVNDHVRAWLSTNSTLNERVIFLYSQKYLSYTEKKYYLKKNFKCQFPYYFIMLWLKTLFPIIWDIFKKEQD